MAKKLDSKKFTAIIIFIGVIVGLLVTEFCTPKNDVFGEQSTLWLVLGLIIGFATYMFGQSLVDAAKEIGIKWVEKKV